MLSRLLFGTINVTAYDLVPEARELQNASGSSVNEPARFGPPAHVGRQKQARLVSRDTLTAPKQGSRMVLYPKSGNKWMTHSMAIFSSL